MDSIPVAAEAFAVVDIEDMAVREEVGGTFGAVR